MQVDNKHTIFVPCAHWLEAEQDPPNRDLVSG